MIDRDRNSVSNRLKRNIVAVTGGLALVAETQLLFMGSMASSSQIEHRMSYLPRFACDHYVEFTAPGADAEHSADSCLAARSGRVALVTYDLTEQKASMIAEKAEELMRSGTDGLIDVSIQPISASKEAMELFHSVNNGCVQDTVLESTGARIADTSMNLTEYSHVVGISTIPACNEGLAGTASGDYGSRYSNVYGHVGNDIDSSLSGEDIADAVAAARVVTHELAHNFGINHTGAINSEQNDEFGYGALFPDGFRVLKGGSLIDINAMITSGTYGEYSGEANIVGVSDGKENHLNSEQRYRLTWPERVKGEIEDSKARVVEHGQSEFIPYATSREHRFVSVRLQEGVSIVTNEDKEEITKSFDQLIIDPVYSENVQERINAGLRINMAYLYLASETDGSTVSLGMLSLHGNEHSHRTIRVGSSKIIIEGVQDKGVSVTLASTS